MDYLRDQDNPSIENFIRLWLPKTFPSNIHCILTCSSSSNNLLYAKNNNFPIITFNSTLFRTTLDHNSFIALHNSLNVGHKSVLIPVLLRFCVENYLELNPANRKKIIIQDHNQILFFYWLIFPSLLNNPDKLKPLSKSNKFKDWLMNMLFEFLPSTVSVQQMSEFLNFINKSIFGLSKNNISKLLKMSVVKTQYLLDFLNPILLKDNLGFRLISPFLTENPIPSEVSEEILQKRFTDLLSNKQHKKNKLLELAYHYSRESQLFNLKQTLSLVDNFLLLFDYSTKYTLFQ